MTSSDTEDLSFGPARSMLDWLNDPECRGEYLTPDEEILVKDVLRRALASRYGSLPEMLERAVRRLDAALETFPQGPFEFLPNRPDTRKHRDLKSW